MTRMDKYHAKKIKHFHGSHVNKLCAIAGVIGGVVGMIVLNDSTALVCSLIFGLPLFFAKGRVFY